MGKADNYGYTVVQHSAMGYKSDITFAQGLETRSLTTAKDVEAVAKAKGRLFHSYREAEDWAQAEMYPPEVQGLVPRAPGTFSLSKVDGLRVYVPKANVAG